MPVGVMTENASFTSFTSPAWSWVRVGGAGRDTVMESTVLVKPAEKQEKAGRTVEANTAAMQVRTTLAPESFTVLDIRGWSLLALA